MKRRISRLTILTLGILIALTGNAFSQQVLFYAHPTVLDIRYQGLVNTQPADLSGLISVKIGQPLDEMALNRSLKTLYALDKFSDAKADVAETTNGLIVTFVVKENPLIRKVNLVGASGFRRSELEDLVLIIPNSYFTPVKLRKSIDAIINKYESDGFVEASVSNFLTPAGTNNNNVFDLTFQITEGAKIVVEKINITGATNIKPADIRGVMDTKEKVFLLQSGVLKPDAFKNDRDKIVQFYQSKGFLDVRITRYEYRIETVGEGDKAHKAIVVYIDIQEGPKYTTGSISITNNSIFATADLMAYVTLKPGDVYDATKMEYAKYQIYNKYSDQGHLYANVSLVENKNPTNHVVDTTIVIYEGPRAHIESITINGNTKTKTYVIARELLFQEGELYIQKKVRQSYEKLNYLQYFSSVDFVPSPGSAEGLINLNINVAEQRTGLITAGVGYGTESGLNGSVTVSEVDLFGTGRTLSFKAEYGQYRQLIEISFQEPWLFNARNYLQLSIGFSRYLYDDVPTDNNLDGIIDYTTNNFNWQENPTTTLSSYTSSNSYHKWNLYAGFTASKKFWVYWSSFLSYTFSMYRYTDANFTIPLIYDSYWQVNSDLTNALAKGVVDWTKKHTVGLGLSLNTTDDPINPLYGAMFDASLYYIGGVFGGDIHFIRPKISFNWYWNPFWKFVLALHASTEAMLPQFGGTIKYDTADMAYFDGVYEMRGWQNHTEYGQSKVFYSGELRFQIYQRELWGLLFFDLGNLWGQSKEWSFAADGYLSSFGIGIKINIPQLPIRLYLARQAYYDTDLGRWHLGASSSDDEEFFKNWQVVFSIQGLF